MKARTEFSNAVARKPADEKPDLMRSNIRSSSQSASRSLLPTTHEWPASLEWPVSLMSPKSLMSLWSHVSPVSEGQRLGGIEQKLRAIGQRNACTARDTAKERLWQLLRDLKAIEKGSAGEVEITEFMPAFDAWYRRSLPFLDERKAREHYLAEFMA